MTEGEEVQKTSKRQEKVIKELETVAANARVKDWTVSQDDIHFCVTMLDKHEQVSLTKGHLPSVDQIMKGFSFDPV